LLAENHSWFWENDLHWEIQVGKTNLNLRDIETRPIPDGGDTPPDDRGPGIGPPVYADTGNLDLTKGTAIFIDFLQTNWWWLLLLIASYLWMRSQRHHFFIIIGKKKKKKKKTTRR
jgi:hypothetical protein